MVSKAWRRDRLKIASLTVTLLAAVVGVLIVWWVG